MRRLSLCRLLSFPVVDALLLWSYPVYCISTVQSVAHSSVVYQRHSSVGLYPCRAIHWVRSIFAKTCLSQNDKRFSWTLKSIIVSLRSSDFWLRQSLKKAQLVIANYRPISVTCLASKILEKIVACKFFDHLYQHSILSSAQHCFLKHHSTCTNLLECFNDWTICVQSRQQITIVLKAGFCCKALMRREFVLFGMSRFGLVGCLTRCAHVPV